MMQTLFTTTDNINTAYTNILNMQFNIASIVNPLMPSITYAAGGTNLEYTYWFGNYPLAPPINGSQLLEVLYPNYSTILNNLATILSIANVNMKPIATILTNYTSANITSDMSVGGMILFVNSILTLHNSITITDITAAIGTIVNNDVTTALYGKSEEILFTNDALSLNMYPFVTQNTNSSNSYSLLAGAYIQTINMPNLTLLNNNIGNILLNIMQLMQTINGLTTYIASDMNYLYLYAFLFQQLLVI